MLVRDQQAVDLCCKPRGAAVIAPSHSCAWTLRCRTRHSDPQVSQVDRMQHPSSTLCGAPTPSLPCGRKRHILQSTPCLARPAPSSRTAASIILYTIVNASYRIATCRLLFCTNLLSVSPCSPAPHGRLLRSPFHWHHFFRNAFV